MTQTVSGDRGTSGVAEQVVQQSRTFLDRQTDTLTSNLAERVAAFSGDLRAIGEHLTDGDSAIPGAQFAGQAANYTDRIAQYLRDADGTRLINDAEDLAERNPILAAGLAVVAGLMTARFLKTSARSRRSENAARMT